MWKHIKFLSPAASPWPSDGSRCPQCPSAHSPGHIRTTDEKDRFVLPGGSEEVRGVRCSWSEWERTWGLHLPPANEIWRETPERPGSRCGASLSPSQSDVRLCYIAGIISNCVVCSCRKPFHRSLPLRVNSLRGQKWDRQQGFSPVSCREQTAQGGTFWSKVLFCLFIFSPLHVIFMFFSSRIIIKLIIFPFFWTGSSALVLGPSS